MMILTEIAKITIYKDITFF